MSTIDTENTATEQPATTPDAAPIDLTAGAIAALDEALASEGAQPAETASPKAATEPAATEPKAEEAAPVEKTVDAEIAELGLKDRTADRFRELTSYKTALKEAGITDVAELPRVIERARFADDLETAIQDTGATPEQYGQAIKYLALVNSGKPEMMAQAYDVMQAELAALAKALGREVPGVHDPLAEHEDLRDEVESGDLTRKRAIEIAQQRARDSLVEGRNNQAQEKHQQQEVFGKAIADLNVLGAQLKGSDPMYAAKIAALQPTIALIRERCQPHEWAARVQQAYRQVVLPAIAPAPAATLPPPGPVRSVAPAGVHMAAEAKDPMDALNMGLAAASQYR